MKRKVSYILKCLLVTLFVSYYCESTLFTHTHNFTWGAVTHSHPFVPSGHHSHTSIECQIISSLTNLLIAVVGVLVVAITVRVITMFYAPQHHFVARHILENCSLRAPPISIC